MNEWSNEQMQGAYGEFKFVFYLYILNTNLLNSTEFKGNS